MMVLALERRTGNLPAEVTRFIGRQRELSQIKAALERYRLVTLRGVGGVGKTRLALHVAADLRQSFDDGVCLVELSALRNAELLARTVAACLGLPDQSSGDPLDLLADHLADRHLLLILDTCEHLVDACAKLAEALLRAAPRLQILATSREPLDVMGEQALLISPLAVPDPDAPAAGFDSVTLFIDRAEAMMPGFALTASRRFTLEDLARAGPARPALRRDPAERGGHLPAGAGRRAVRDRPPARYGTLRPRGDRGSQERDSGTDRPHPGQPAHQTGARDRRAGDRGSREP
jgi:non-specific serine/threonine protein kinase